VKDSSTTSDTGPLVRRFVFFLVGCIAVGTLCVVLALENRNGARPFALVAAVLAAAFVVATLVAIVKVRKGTR
jgi:hypothetical protein